MKLAQSVLFSGSQRQLSRWLIELHDFCTLETVTFLQGGPVEHELHDVLLGWCGLHAVDDGFKVLVDVGVALDLGSNWSEYLWTSGVTGRSISETGTGFETEIGPGLAGAGVEAKRPFWNGIGVARLKSKVSTRSLYALCMASMSAAPTGVDPGRWPKLSSMILFLYRNLFVS
jgi:hypothetical protein